MAILCKHLLFLLFSRTCGGCDLISLLSEASRAVGWDLGGRRRRVFHQYNNDGNEADLPEPNFTEGGGAPSTSVKCVKGWRALLDYWDGSPNGARKGGLRVEKVGMRGGPAAAIVVFPVSLL